MTSRQTYWAEQTPLFERIKTAGGFEPYTAALSGMGEAFMLADRSLRCIDERVSGGINLAGSGILMDEEALIDNLRAIGIDGIFSHEDCGAVKFILERRHLEVSRADDYAKEFSGRVARRLQVPYRGHLPVTPRGQHIARVIYYDGTGRFNPMRHQGFPPGFVVSRRYLDLEYALSEVKMAAGIAFGEHGFGDLFTADNPLFLVAIGTTMAEADALRNELASAAKSNPLLRLDSFVAPRAS